MGYDIFEQNCIIYFIGVQGRLSSRALKERFRGVLNGLIGRGLVEQNTGDLILTRAGLVVFSLIKKDRRYHSLPKLFSPE